MANKQLTASVRLNTTQFEQRLKRIARGIDALNNAVGKQSNAYQQVNAALGKTDKLTNDVKKKTDATEKSTKKWVSALNSATSKLTRCKSIVGALSSKMGRLASTLFGIGTITLAIQGADELTGAQNKFNNIASKQLGDSAYTKDASGNITGYSDKALSFTEDTMDKIYTSAQKTRILYSDMLSNVSKTMTLAPDAFKGNIDNAIRFQEIMAEAYAVGGASAAEMSTSMYQLTQALGAGTLAGDELRSVREGAPLAYQKIEEFAQGVYNTSESLKDLAADGKITSDLVVAAVMNMGNEMDQAFALTKYRFTDVWSQIKSSAQKAFSPVVEMMTNKLNEAVENGLIQKFETFFTNVAKAAMIAFTLIEQAIYWCADNWSWLKDVIVAGLILIMAYEAALIAARIAHAYTDIMLWIAENQAAWAYLLTIIKIIAVIALVAIGIYLLWQVWSNFANGACTLGEAIIKTLLIIGVVGMLIAFIFGGWIPGLIILAVALILAAVALLFGFVCSLFAFLAAIVVDVIAFIINLVAGCGSVIVAVCKNIGIAFQNAWIWAKNTFWEFIADVIDGISGLEPVINGIAKLLGKDGVDFSGLSGSIRSKKSEYIEFVSLGDAWSSGWNTVDFANPADWSNAAYDWGSNLMNFQKQSSGSTEEKTSLLDGLGNKLGLTDQFDSLANVGDQTAINPNSADELLGDVGNISDNTDTMVDLSEEDLEYLRKIAATEWKKEYTTANIKVDMTNNNTINNQGDLEDWAVKLSEILTEELHTNADGVYMT